MDNKKPIYYVGTITLIDGTERKIDSEPASSRREVVGDLSKTIREDSELEVALAGNPTKWDKDMWAAGLQYCIREEYLDGKTIVEVGYVIPSDQVRGGIFFRKSMRFDLATKKCL